MRTNRHDTAVCLITNHYRVAGTTHGHMTRRRVVHITWCARREDGRGFSARENMAVKIAFFVAKWYQKPDKRFFEDKCVRFIKCLMLFKIK